jgi:hypothetical protein
VLQLLHMTVEEHYPWEIETRRRQRRRRAWLMIGLPLFVGTALIAGTITAVVMTGFGTIGTWADISLVLMLLPLCVLGFLPLVLLIGLSYGIGRLVGWLPDPLAQTDDFMARVASGVRRGGDMAVRPMLSWKGVLATVETFLRGLIGIIR